jgi:nitrite reductase/ring-hydroxylating ferredoxin subunit
LVEVQGKKIALFNVDGKFHAIDNACTHREGKVSTGEVLSLPAPQAVGSYKVRVNGPDIELGL